MESEQTPATKQRQPSKLDDHPLIPLTDFEDRMREVPSVTPEEMQRRETEYQRQQEQKKRNRKT